MSDPAAESEPRARLPLVLAFFVAFYLLAYFPAFSFMTRHPEYQRCSIIWRPLPGPIGHAMFKVWKHLDPTGYSIVDEAAHLIEVEETP